MSWQRWIVGPEVLSRVDLHLCDRLGLSRRAVRALLERGWVRLDGRPLGPGDAGDRLVGGETLEVIEDPAALDRLVVSPVPIRLLREGDGWIALDKPAGLPVHPLDAREPDSLLQRALGRWPGIEGIGEAGLRSGVVHRLDVDTSGVQLLATHEAGWRRLRAAFSSHRVDKVYRALVHGHPAEHGEVELELRVARHRPARVAVGPGTGARPCGLRWRVVETFAGAALLEVRPRTGFLHQVRASLAHLGHPLLGDAVYGGSGALAARHLLHARRVSFEEIEAEAEDPPDLLAVLDALRAGAEPGGDRRPPT